MKYLKKKQLKKLPDDKLLKKFKKVRLIRYSFFTGLEELEKEEKKLKKDKRFVKIDLYAKMIRRMLMKRGIT